MIDIDGLTRRYGDTTVVDTVTLQVQRGELIALVGGSGAGKTTLLKMINRLIEPTAGCVRLELDGRIPVERMRASNLAADGQGRSPAAVAGDLLNVLRHRGSDAAPAR